MMSPLLSFFVGIIFLLLILFWQAKILSLRWRPAFYYRSVMLVLILLVIFNPFQGEGFEERIPQVLLLDLSESLPENTRLNLITEAADWQNQELNRVVIAFGAGGDVVFSSGDLDLFNQDQVLETNFTDALILAENILGSTEGEIIILSDGLAQDSTGAEFVAADLIEHGHQISYDYRYPRDVRDDIYIQPVWVPTGIWQGSQFAIILPVYSPITVDAVVELHINGALYELREVSLQPGVTYIPFYLIAEEVGVITAQAVVSSVFDSFEENNIWYSAIEVFPAPRVLMVSREQEEASRMWASLSRAGIQMSIITPDELPHDLSELLNYQVVIINDLMAREISFEQMIALEHYVADYGRGLIFIGGRNAYTLGGYEGTVFERMLPVAMLPPDRDVRSPITFVMVLDRSGSMVGSRSERIPPISLAKEAAIRAIESLRAEDFIGVLSYSSTMIWDVPIRQLGSGADLRSAQDAISQMQATGGTLMYAGLEEAVSQMLLERPTETLHILLLSDGVSGDGSLEEFRNLAAFANSENITISTIAFGQLSDIATMEAIAELGGGRYYFVDDPQELTEIMVAESQAAHSENIQEGTINLITGAGAHPIMGSFSPSEIPTLSAYNALQSRSNQGAEDILISSSFHDPVLSAWQYGVGRVVAWSGDIGNDWAQAWNLWPRQGEFWARVIRYTLPDPRLDRPNMQFSQENGQYILDMQIQSRNFVPLNQSYPEFSFLQADGLVYANSLIQIAPGAYQGVFPQIPNGAYHGYMEYLGEDGLEHFLYPFAVNYPDEYRPANPEAGLSMLSAWADQSGGRAVSLTEEDLVDEEQQTSVDFSRLLLFGILIYWIAEIAIRRQRMPWR